MKRNLIFIYCSLFVILVSSFFINPYHKKITTSLDAKVLHTSSMNIKEITEVDLRVEEEVTEDTIVLEEKEVVGEMLSEKPVVEEVITVEDEDASIEKDEYETVVGGLSAYGPDCVGCSGVLASGFQASSSHFTYVDSTYGEIRILAGDRSYPFGTIVRVNGTSMESFYGIVLDRGGIGFGKRYLFDLLFPSEADASSFGSFKNISFEIIRIGY